MESSGWVGRLRAALGRTRAALSSQLTALLGEVADDALFDGLEELLIKADVGAALAGEIVARLRQEPSARTPDSIRAALAAILRELLGPPGVLRLDPPPAALLVVGTNGSGKTTTIGKLAWRLLAEGRRPLLAAADTFRAAAIAQLEVWGERVGAPVIRQQSGADPAAVVFDAAQAALARRAEVLIVDTAGRLHTKVNLMEELKKIDRVLARALPGAPVERLLVLDATTGQNGLAQARRFHEAIGLTGAIVAKLDGTARGGIVVAVARDLRIPITFVGTGEAADDLVPFDPGTFVEALLAA